MVSYDRALIAIVNCFDLARRGDFYDGTRARTSLARNTRIINYASSPC